MEQLIYDNISGGGADTQEAAEEHPERQLDSGSSTHSPEHLCLIVYLEN